MVRIRLRRVGSKGQPSYRIVVADKESPRDGRFLEVLGNYNPRTQPAWIELDEPRVFHWLKNGAQPSASVTQIFQSIGLPDRYERYRNGEDLDGLNAEAKAAEAQRNINAKTQLTQSASNQKSEK